MQGAIRGRMNGMADAGYAVFQKKLIFTGYRIEGIRVPELRALIASASEADLAETLAAKNFDSFEEVLAYGFCLGRIKDAEKVKNGLEFILPAFDNWAHVDCITASLTAVRRNRAFFLDSFWSLYCHEGEFYKRFLAVMLMDFYLDEKYFSEALKIYKKIVQGQYYTDMALAWGLSVMLVKFYDEASAALKANCFSPFVHNKAIQKAVESRRITEERKAYLRTLKVKS